MSERNNNVTVRDTINNFSVMVLHAMTQEVPNFGKDVVKDLYERLDNFIKLKYPDKALPCFTYHLKNDDWYKHIFPQPPTEGVILKNGHIILAGDRDLGTDYDRKNTNGIIPKEVKDLNNIIDSKRENYNELSVIYPQIAGFYLMIKNDLNKNLDSLNRFYGELIKKYTYTREEIHDACTKLDLDVFFISQSSIYKAVWHLDNYVPKEKLLWSAFINIINRDLNI